MKYVLYVDNTPVHESDEWYEAHELHTKVHGIKEWSGLAIYTSIDGIPMWGTTPERQKDTSTRRRLSALRSHYLRKAPDMTQEERQQVAQQKLALLVTTTQEELARM